MLNQPKRKHEFWERVDRNIFKRGSGTYRVQVMRRRHQPRAQHKTVRTLAEAYRVRAQFERIPKSAPGHAPTVPPLSHAEYKRRRAAKFYAAGLCTNCGDEPFAPGKRQCQSCLDVYKVKYRARREARSTTV